MYVSFMKNREYYCEFFKKYSKRILFGTDSTFPGRDEGMQWVCDRVYRYFATNDAVKSFEDNVIEGINLPKEHREDILYKNFEKRVGINPKPINKEALKRYIEKYKHLIIDKRLAKRIEELSKEYL